MLRRPRVYLALFLCFIATGAQWDLVQTFAWGRMVATYAKSMPLTKAVSKTFSGEMCGLCTLVASTEKQDRNQSTVPEVKSETKMLLFFQDAPNTSVNVPIAVTWIPSDPVTTTVGRAAPPVPPPRVAAV